MPAKTRGDVKAIWRKADAVTFDVDSTVCRDEGIDELAAFVGRSEDVTKLTANAMRGSMTFKEALEKRLAIIKPSQQVLQKFQEQHPPLLTDGIKDLVSYLQQKGVPVYLISGGFRSIIEPVAHLLDIPVTNIYANRLMFYSDGSYAGFDERCPTCNSGGKSIVISNLKKKHNYQRLVHLGDGATDVEACPPADAFIGFGGNQVRQTVKEKSRWFVTDFQELINELRAEENS